MIGIIAHHYWGRPGGGQLVSAAAAHSLDYLGIEPVLVGSSKFSPEKYGEWFGLPLTSYKIYTPPIRLKAFGLFTRVLLWYPLKKAIKQFDPDLIWTDEVTYKPILNERRFKLIEYVHFPFELYVDSRFKNLPFYYKNDPYIFERYGRFPMNIYFEFFLYLLKKTIRENPFEVCEAVLTNSKWTAEKVELAYGMRPIVLNPPIPPNVEILKDPPGFHERQKIVVMVGRFSEEKRYHWVIRQVMPKILKEDPEVKLYIFGGAGTPTAFRYVEYLQSTARKTGLKLALNKDSIKEEEYNVLLYTDAPRSLINSTMDKAKVFFHATINEHWGVVVTEAMARGLPVTIHDSGGASSDIVENGLRGFVYNTAEEAAEKVVKLMNEERTWNMFSSRGLEKAENLTFDKFHARHKDIIEKII